MDNLMNCLYIPLSVVEKIIGYSKDEEQLREEWIYYWRNVSLYSMIGWGYLGGKLHYRGQEAALRAANEYIQMAPGTCTCGCGVYMYWNVDDVYRTCSNYSNILIVRMASLSNLFPS
jgi:hypothetical protein